MIAGMIIQTSLLKHADNKGVYLSNEKMEAFLKENNLRLEDIKYQEVKNRIMGSNTCL